CCWERPPWPHRPLGLTRCWRPASAVCTSFLGRSSRGAMAAKPHPANASRPSPERVPEAGNPGARALELDRLIHARTRRAIVSALAGNPSPTFTELKKPLDATDGNLSVHARKLEEAGYVECTKGFRKRMPRTESRLTT